MNTVLLLGNAGRTPEPRTTSTGKLVCELSLATNRSRKTDDGWVDVTDWHRITLWEKDADRAIQHIRPGTPVAVQGYLKTDSWTDANNQKRFRTHVVAHRMEILGRPPQFSTQGDSHPSHFAAQTGKRMDDTAGAPMMTAPDNRPGPLVETVASVNTDDIPF